MKRYVYWLIGMSMLWIAFPRSVLATTVVAKNFTVPADSTIEEVSVTMGDLLLYGSVTDSAKVTAGDAQVWGRIEGDLSVTLGEAHIEGQVNGKVIIKQGDLFVTGEIGKGTTVWLGDATVSGKIKGDLLLRNGDLYLDGGTIEGDVEILFGDVSLESGTITGSLTVRNGRVSGDIGTVRGSVSVTSGETPSAIQVEGLVELPAKLEKIAKTIAVPAGLLSIFLLVILSIVSFIVSLGLVMAIIYIFRISPVRAGRLLTRRELFITILSGLGGFLVLSAAIPLSAVTIVFLPVAVLLIALATIALIFGFAVVIIVTGRFFFKQLLNWDLPDWLCAVLGFLLLCGLLLLPIINSIALISYLLLSLGVALRLTFGKREVVIPGNAHSGVGQSPAAPAPAPGQNAGLARKTDGESLTSGNT